MPNTASSYFCPGRVNLIGEHIDYNGGLVLPAAISLGITATISASDGQSISISSDHTDEVVVLPIGNISARPGHWSDHIIGVLLELKHNGLPLAGCEVRLSSTLPQGSGLSSSAAIEVLTYYMFTHWQTGKEPDRREMALACQRVENKHIGVSCGIMDQYAVSFGKQGHALLLDCAMLDHREIPVHLGDHALLIINSNAPRTLATTAYNARRAECDAALDLIRQYRAIDHLAQATLDDVKAQLDPVIRKRVRHVVTEKQRVHDASDALTAGNLLRFGGLLNASHASLRDDYEVSSPQLDHIVSEAQKHSGCLGARLTGAGFGGCCIALMDRASLEPFHDSLATSYKARFGLEPDFHVCAISDGVHLLTQG